MKRLGLIVAVFLLVFIVADVATVLVGSATISTDADGNKRITYSDGINSAISKGSIRN